MLFKLTIALASVGIIYAGIIDHPHGYHIVTKHTHHHGHSDGGLHGAASGIGIGADFGGYGGGYGSGDNGHHDYYVRYIVN